MYREPIDAIITCTCPPPTAITMEAVGYRLVKSTPMLDIDFHSHAALGKRKPPDLDECRWSSCSLFCKLESLVGINGLPKLKGVWAGVAEIPLNISSGPYLTQTSGHIDWWPLASFNILGNASIVKVFP